MPSFVSRKKISHNTIVDLDIELSMVWSRMRYMLDTNTINERTLTECMDDLTIAQKRLQVRLPPKKNINIWHLYIVQCANGAYYTGITADIDTRIKVHNSGKGAKCLKALGLPVKLVYSELVGNYSQALKRECQIKKLSRKKKEELIKSINNK